MTKDSPYWYPRCPACGSDEVDFEPFTGGKSWRCQDCGMSFDQSEEDDEQCLWQVDREHAHAAVS